MASCCITLPACEPSAGVQELLYANKLAARRRALGLVPDKEAATTPSGADASAAPTGTASGGFADAAGAPDSDDADIELLHGALASLVAREAVKALPKDIGLRQRLLRVTHQVPCLGTQALKQQLTDGMLLDFAEVRSRRRSAVASCSSIVARATGCRVACAARASRSAAMAAGAAAAVCALIQHASGRR